MSLRREPRQDRWMKLRPIPDARQTTTMLRCLACKPMMENPASQPMRYTTRNVLGGRHRSALRHSFRKFLECISWLDWVVLGLVIEHRPDMRRVESAHHPFALADLFGGCPIDDHLPSVLAHSEAFRNHRHTVFRPAASLTASWRWLSFLGCFAAHYRFRL